jgi:chromosome partitioning protein
MNIAVTNLKGGVGKTTSTIYLAAAAMERGYEPVVVVDADRQASSAEWLDARPIEGVTLIEAPSERTITKAMAKNDGITVVDLPPGDERLVKTAMDLSDAVVIPTRAGGIEFSRVERTVEILPSKVRFGVVVCSARLGTNDLEETINWWKKQSIPVWGVIPERVGVAAGPEARLHREVLDLYHDILKKAVRR